MDTLRKLGYDYGLTKEGVRHAIETYQDIIHEITGGRLSKLTYDADFVIEEAEKYYKWKYGYDEEQVVICSCCGNLLKKNWNWCPWCRFELRRINLGKSSK